jgi:putative nucleotidyltransferase with HDIG domain
MNLKLPLLVIKILETLESSECEAYVVGGAVRDILMKVKVTDWDFTTKAKPEEVVKLFKGAYYDNRFGTVGVAAKHLGGKDDSVYEITTFRSESGYSDRRRPDKVTFGTSLRNDLKRRDFTINALALRILKIVKKDKSSATAQVEIVDPFGGQADLKSKQIKAVGTADLRFAEDALRMMRAIRIASQLGFVIETKTLMAITKNKLLLNHIAKERIRDELKKIVASPYPKDGIKLLFTSGLLEQIIPELITTREVEQAGHHTKDVWNHSLDALAACPSQDPIVRLATLLHDVGKPTSKKNLGPGKEITFYNHEVIGARMVKQIARRLKFSKKEIDLLWLLVRWHMFAYEPKMTDKAIRRFIKRIGKQNIDKMIQLRVGDRIGGGSKETSWRLEEFQQRIKEVLVKPFEITDLKVSGSDVMTVLSLSPGPKVGKILNQLFQEVEKDNSKNKRDYLLKRLKELI